MTTYALRDSRTMLRRNLVHALRYPGLSLSTILMPVIMLLIFAGLFGGTLGAGLGGGAYIDYLAPGILVMAATSGSVSTAVSVAMDMKEGIINRFRTMAISRSSVLIGHVVGSMVQTLISIAVVAGVAVLMGWRPGGELAEWLGAAGVLTAAVFALTWLAAAMGIVAKSVESASNLPMPVMFLPMLGSGFVPTDSLPAIVRWFAEYQPFTPIIETIRGLLMNQPVGHNGYLAIGWCVALSALGYFWARSAFRKN
jgi:ABC-2 type transport system permease protein